jgi:sulfoxide reductase heme-binding subunit YedZ
VARPERRFWIQAAAVGLGLLPFLGLCVAAATDRLGANPIEEVTHVTGEFTLRFLLASLAVTPLRRVLGWSWAAPLRRTFGLLAFSYGTLHLLTYVVLDQFFDWPALLEDVLERRYITVGFLGWLCMVPLALTSTRGWQRRLGRRWTTLHRLAYVAASAGVVHFLWLVKADLLAPLVHAALLAALLGYRLWHARARALPDPGRNARLDR